MTKKQILFIMFLVISVLSFSACTVFAQGLAADKDMQKATIKGKIGFMERFGGYYVMGENPPSEIFIVNQDKKTLSKFQKSGKTVTIKGHFTIGADHFMIEKINGKKYPQDTSK